LLAACGGTWAPDQFQERYAQRVRSYLKQKHPHPEACHLALKDAARWAAEGILREASDGSRRRCAHCHQKATDAEPVTIFRKSVKGSRVIHLVPVHGGCATGFDQWLGTASYEAARILTRFEDG
jgi:hypothetical protein